MRVAGIAGIAVTVGGFGRALEGGLHPARRPGQMLLAAFCQRFPAFPIFEGFIQTHLAQFEDAHDLDEFIAGLLVVEAFNRVESVIAGTLAENSGAAHGGYSLKI